MNSDSELHDEAETSPAHDTQAIAQAPAPNDPVAAVTSLGLRSDTPRAVVKAIVSAVQATDGKDLKEVKLALSNFNLPELLEPGSTVRSLATGLVELAHTSEWNRLGKQSA